MTSQTHPQEVPELVEQLDRVLAMDAQTATDREWSDLLAVALDCRETLSKAAPPVEGDLRALVFESLYHLRMDDAAKAYHEKALAALQRPSCTCHPDDRPDGPCRQRYAASECRATPVPTSEENGNG